MIVPNYPPLADDPTTQAFAVRGLNKIFAGRPVVSNLSLDIPRGSIYGIVGPNGAGKSTLIKLLINQLSPLSGDAKRNPRLRIGYFSQHHIDQLDLTQSPVAFLASRFPGRTEQEYLAVSLLFAYYFIAASSRFSMSGSAFFFHLSHITVVFSCVRAPLCLLL